MKIHTAEKNYSCALCDYKGARKCYLIKHMKIHTAEKNYTCALCDFRGVRKCHLLKHMKIHTTSAASSQGALVQQDTLKTTRVLQKNHHTKQLPRENLKRFINL
jgi:KRAB domain-containing zinc finger protein